MHACAEAYTERARTGESSPPKLTAIMSSRGSSRSCGTESDWSASACSWRLRLASCSRKSVAEIKLMSSQKARKPRCGHCGLHAADERSMRLLISGAAGAMIRLLVDQGISCGCRFGAFRPHSNRI